MLKREELEVGSRYLTQYGSEVEVTAIGNSRLLYLKETTPGVKREHSTRIKYILENWDLPKLKGKKYVSIFKYPNGDIIGASYQTRESADEMAYRLDSWIQRIACVEVDWTEGDGLDV